MGSIGKVLTLAIPGAAPTHVALAGIAAGDYQRWRDLSDAYAGIKTAINPLARGVISGITEEAPVVKATIEDGLDKLLKPVITKGRVLLGLEKDRIVERSQTKDAYVTAKGDEVDALQYGQLAEKATKGLYKKMPNGDFFKMPPQDREEFNFMKGWQAEQERMLQSAQYQQQQDYAHQLMRQSLMQSQMVQYGYNGLGFTAS